MLVDKDDDRLDDRYIAHNGAHGFGAGMYAEKHLCRLNLKD